MLATPPNFTLHKILQSFNMSHENLVKIQLKNDTHESQFPHSPRILCMVDLKSDGSMPSLNERLDISEQFEMADNFLWTSVDSFLPAMPPDAGSDTLRSILSTSCRPSSYLIKVAGKRSRRKLLER